jgi:diguanylate cyclase (GGDEF)-like protein
MVRIQKLSIVIKDFWKTHQGDILYLLGILFSLVILHYMRLKVHAFGISLGYIYLLVIMMGALGFGLWGGIAVAGISALIFIIELHVYQHYPMRDIVQRGMYYRFISYFALGGILGYYVNIVSRQKRLLRNLADSDHLTGLNNYRYFSAELHKIALFAERYDSFFSLVIMDLDYFKSINDTYGHPVGDALLKRFAAVLKENLREGDTEARYGGDEFLLLLPRQTALEAREVINRIAAKIKSIDINAKNNTSIPCPITLSAGIASFPYNAVAENLMVAADDALYWAKQCGRDQIFESWGTIIEWDEGRRECDRRRILRFEPDTEKAKQFTLKPDASGQSLPITVRNISLTGALIECDRPFISSEAVEIAFFRTVGPGVRKAVRIKAEVIAGRMKTEGVYEANVVFRSINCDSLPAAANDSEGRSQ